MKITSEIKNAFDVLLNHAENDFELHRINKLLDDLTQPPRVEVIDAKHQRFNGVTFRKRKAGHYFTPMYSIYHAVWNYYYGELPPNTIIHHIDQNKDNNNIENLIPMSPSEHRKLHASLNQKHFIAPLRDLVCERCGKVYQARFSGKNKFCPDCRKIPKPSTPQKKILKTCLWCGAEFETTSKTTETCSAHCKNRLVYFRKTGKIKAERLKTCEVCGKTFVVCTAHNQSRDRKTCSPECSMIARSQKHKPPTDLTCAICGKIFHNKNLKTKTCSPECYRTLQKQIAKNKKETIQLTLQI